ncbi:hypothetical protein POM88_051056 [Heracleum sosnowskyi]|uniref:Uncharacterized protein n=1 Tax=Heracleum sosnowskyi TaxID=360622 RepID=A0AAD8GYP0_9APIA|nr:hypothetical protein POM88_051056 [Heracleum sosnowskyi]
MLLELMVRRVSNARKDFDSGNLAKYFYPRFLTIIINHLLSDAHKEFFRNAPFVMSPTTSNMFFTRLQTTSRYIRLPVVPDSFMISTLQPAGQHVPEQQIVTSTGTLDAIPLQVVLPILGSSSGTFAETQEGVRADQEFVELQTLTQVIEPNTESTTSLTTQPEQNVHVRHRSSSREDSLRDPAALSPPPKKRRTFRETSVSPFVSSRQDMDLEMAIEQVIFPAGTSSRYGDRQLVVRTEIQTWSETQARELSETPLREIEVSAHIDTNTASLLAQIDALQKQLSETQAEKEILQAQVVERSSSSTSITNQLGIIKDDVEGLKISLLPKLNAIQQSQILVASNISGLSDSNAQIADSVKEIASISAKGDDDDDDDDNDDQGDGGDGGERREEDDVPEETIPEDIFGEEEVEEEVDCVEWDEQDDLFNPGPVFEEELRKQQEDIRRKQDENAKVSQIIFEKLQVQKVEHEEKPPLHSLEVKDRKLDIRLKKGDKWTKAKEMFALPQKGSNNDREFIGLLQKFKKVNPDNSIYMKALQEEILRIITGFDRVRNEMVIYVSCQSIGSLTVSLDCFASRSLLELWVLMSRVKESSYLNVLLHEQLKEYAIMASPQVVDVPFEVKFYKGRAHQSCGVDHVSLKTYPAMHLIKLENMQRTTGFASEEKTEVADIIQDYCITNIKRYHQLKNRLKKVTTQLVRPSNLTSESDRVLDKDLLDALEEGEMSDQEK